MPAESDERRFLGSAGAPAAGGVCDSYARKFYAVALVIDDSSTLDDLREAGTIFEDSERTARRVLGGAHPVTKELGHHLQTARAALRARESGAP